LEAWKFNFLEIFRWRRFRRTGFFTMPFNQSKINEELLAVPSSLLVIILNLN